MSAASQYIQDLDSKSKEQLKTDVRELTSSLQQATKAEEDAVEMIFQLHQGLDKLISMTSQAGKLATGFSLKQEITAIEKLAKELRAI
jgi:hypothetical protein